MRLGLVIDYQNVHLTGHDVFDEYRPIEESLIDPVSFAKRVTAVRSSSNVKNGYPEVELGSVLVFRGLPSAEHDPSMYRRNQAQRDAWLQHASRVGVDLSVEYRPLKYKFNWANGRKTVDLSRRPQEKGVDVLCALAVARLAREARHEIVILASRDTDLVPALEEGHRSGSAKIEAVKWFDPAVRSTRGSLNASTFRMWTTSLTKTDFSKSLDQRDYQ